MGIWEIMKLPKISFMFGEKRFCMFSKRCLMATHHGYLTESIRVVEMYGMRIGEGAFVGLIMTKDRFSK